MPDYDSKYLNTYLNGITYENAFWKSRYNNLWQQFLFLQNENYRLQNLLNECYELNNLNLENISNYTTDNTNNTTNNSITDNTKNSNNIEIISHLQKKNNELLKNVMNKSKEIFILQAELEKHKVST
jgi:hypothetical protein